MEKNARTRRLIVLIWLVFLLIAFLSSCGTKYHYNKFIKKGGQLVTQYDTIQITSIDSILVDSVWIKTITKKDTVIQFKTILKPITRYEIKYKYKTIKQEQKTVRSQERTKRVESKTERNIEAERFKKKYRWLVYFSMIFIIILAFKFRN